MATYASLSAQDKEVVQATVQLIRALAGGVGRMFNSVKAIEDDTNAINLILSIDAGETIPNESGLAGADDMTRSEIAAAYSDFTAMKTTYDTGPNRAEWSKLAGAINLLGEI